MDIFELLQADIERWLAANGYDVDLESLPEDEIAEFWANLPDAQYEDLAGYIEAATLVRRYEAGEITQADESLVPSEPFEQLKDIAGEGIMYLPALRTGRLVSWVAARAATRVPQGTRVATWLWRMVNRAKPAAAAPAAAAIRKSGFGRVDDIAQLGTRAGAVLARTTAGAGQAAGAVAKSPLVSPLIATAATGAVGITAAMKGAEKITGGIDSIYENIQQGKDGSAPAEDSEPDVSKIARYDETTDTFSSLTGDNPSLLKQIYYQGLSETEAFDKMTNYVAGTGALLTATGASIGQALQNQPDVFGGASEVVDLSTTDGREILANYLQAKWWLIPDIADRVGEISSSGAAASATAILRGQGEFLQDVINQYVGELAQQSAVMLITPEEPGRAGDMIGIITSYDGSPFGEIQSLNDLTSGGKVGWMNAAPLLDAASPEQITLWQQQLYAWGFLSKPPEVWGQLTVDATGDIPTQSAFHNWQINVFNEGVAMVREAAKKGNNKSLSELIAPDGTPRADRVLDRVIATRMAGDETRATRAGDLRQGVLDETRDRITNYLSSTGRTLPMGARLQLEGGINQVIDGLSPQRQEEAFGQGGSPYERALAENILREFYGTDNWGSELTFGNKNRDEDFFNYASRVGAVSTRERTLLNAGAIRRDRYRSHWKERYDELKGVEKDVAVATLLKFISESMGQGADFSTVTASNIANGLTSYAHTIGHRRALDAPTSYQQMVQQGNTALDRSRSAQFGRDEGLLSDVATGSVDAMSLQGGVAGYRYRDLVDALNRVSQAGHLRSENV